VVYDQSRTREAHEEDETHEGREDHEDGGREGHGGSTALCFGLCGEWL